MNGAGKAVCVLPARGGSKRLPRKNILPLLGKPMLAWPIAAAQQSGLFETIVVSTDDPEIAALARDAGAETVDRPDEFATDTITEHGAVLHAIDHLARQGHSYTFGCCVYPTACLIEPEDLTQSRALFDAVPRPDTVMSVSDFAIHPYKAMQADSDGFLKPVHPDWVMRRSQDYPVYLASNGTFYWFEIDSYRQRRNFYGERLAPYILPRERAVDIDVAGDLVLAEALLARRCG